MLSIFESSQKEREQNDMFGSSLYNSIISKIARQYCRFDVTSKCMMTETHQKLQQALDLLLGAPNTRFEQQRMVEQRRLAVRWNSNMIPTARNKTVGDCENNDDGSTKCGSNNVAHRETKMRERESERERV